VRALFHYLSNTPKKQLNPNVFSIKMTHFTVDFDKKHPKHPIFKAVFDRKKPVFGHFMAI
jgi:hypothetical protein